jgi:hypothetical protein
MDELALRAEIAGLRRALGQLAAEVLELRSGAGAGEETMYSPPAFAAPPPMDIGPARALEIPPAVGVGAVGTKKGTYALEDHTHDFDGSIEEVVTEITNVIENYVGTWIDVVTGVRLDEYGLHIDLTGVKVLDTRTADPESYALDVTDCDEEES